MQNSKTKNEIYEILKCIKAGDTKKIEKVNLENINKLKLKINSFLDLYDLKNEITTYNTIEEIEERVSLLFNFKKTTLQKVKYFEKLNGFYNNRKKEFEWDKEKIDEFFTSLMK